MNRLALTLLILTLAFPLLAGEPSAIEDSNFAPESAWNRQDGALQYNSFYLAGATAHELAEEWAVSGGHQFGFTVPVYTERTSGIGDVALNYRHQIAGGDGTKTASAVRLSLLLPTRSVAFGGRSTGVQVNVPLSAQLTPRLTSHTNTGFTWFSGSRENEVNLAQGFAVALTERIAAGIDAAYTRGSGGSELLVVRPGIQMTIDGPAGLQIAPGIAFPRGGASEGVLLFVALERPFAR